MKKRFFAFYIDQLICAVISQCLIAILGLVKNEPEYMITYFYEYVFLFAFLMLIKDLIFKNQSIGKRIFHLKIVKNNNQLPKLFDLILRNITLPIWPIEFIMLLIFKRRIGEYITGTKVMDA